jgi:hypothetical protein
VVRLQFKSQRVALVATRIAKPPDGASVFVKTGKIHPVWFSQFFKTSLFKFNDLKILYYLHPQKIVTFNF